MANFTGKLLCHILQLSLWLRMHGEGVSRQTVHTLQNTVLSLQGGVSVARKTRVDKGRTLLNSEKKRSSIYTSKFVFNKQFSKDKPDAKLDKQTLDKAWKNATPQEERKRCTTQAEEWKELLGPYLISEITKALHTTSGADSWRQIATLVSDTENLEALSYSTIRKHIMALPDSCYKSTRILPKLDEANKQHCYWWAQQFLIFWESAKTFAPRVQVILVHMDEKWFWTLVVRKFLKCVPFLGVEPIVHGVQSKTNLDKKMVIASITNIPHNNDIQAGGQSFLLNLTRVGRMVPAEKNSNKRVYKGNGTARFHYPKIAANCLRKKGELYFKSMEIAGSSKGTQKNPKFNLLSWFRDVEIPALDSLCRPITEQTGKIAVVRYQMDSAGPHKDKELLTFLKSAFAHESRKWMLQFQPSNSPMTNINDDCIFPALSKHVSAEQGITKGSVNFTYEELWDAIQNFWHALRLDRSGRAFIRHRQIASAIAHCKGSDEFVQESSSLHCGIWKCCFTVCDRNGEPYGVEVVQVYDQDDGLDRQELRYFRPNEYLKEAAIQQNLLQMTRAELMCISEHMLPEKLMHGMALDALAEQERREMVAE